MSVNTEKFYLECEIASNAETSTVDHIPDQNNGKIIGAVVRVEDSSFFFLVDDFCEKSVVYSLIESFLQKPTKEKTINVKAGTPQVKSETRFCCQGCENFSAWSHTGWGSMESGHVNTVVSVFRSSDEWYPVKFILAGGVLAYIGGFLSNSTKLSGKKYKLDCCTKGTIYIIDLVEDKDGFELWSGFEVTTSEPDPMEEQSDAEQTSEDEESSDSDVDEGAVDCAGGDEWSDGDMLDESDAEESTLETETAVDLRKAWSNMAEVSGIHPKYSVIQASRMIRRGRSMGYNLERMDEAAKFHHDMSNQLGKTLGATDATRAEPKYHKFRSNLGNGSSSDDES